MSLISTAACGRVVSPFFISLKEMGNVAKLLGGVLERLNLLAQLCLLGLLLPQDFMDISHNAALLWEL